MVAAVKTPTRASLSRSTRTRRMATGFVLTKLTKERMPVLPFLRMKNVILGKSYTLSLVAADDAYSKALNRRYRKKTYIPNVLSFPLEKNEGEIILNLKQAKRECAVREESFRYFVALLFIHSSLHLEGYRHGSTMERRERELLSKFHINNTLRS